MISMPSSSKSSVLTSDGREADDVVDDAGY
jgi:hypothetical protein